MDGGIPLRDCAAATSTSGHALRGVFDAASATPFEGFFRRNHDFVWRNLRRLGVETAVVDDALQDVFVTAHRRIGQLRADASERAWLYTILRRVAFRYRRSAKRRRRKIDALETVAPSEHRDHTAESFDARRFMHGFLEGLGDKRGPVFAMVELEGMSAPEVADALGLKVNTVYSRLRLGREAFEREVERRHVRERDELLARARQADDPPVGAAAAAWMLIDPRLLGHAGSSSAWSLASQVKVFAVTVAVGTVMVAGARVLSSERPQAMAPPAPSPIHVAESTSPRRARPRSPPNPRSFSRWPRRRRTRDRSRSASTWRRPCSSERRRR
jgi:RNA polymerase sigma-70 factor (ECF subfamily)